MVILWINFRVRPPPSWNSVFGTTWLRFSSRSRFRARARNLVGPGPGILDLNTDISLYLWVQYLGMTFWNRSKAKYILITRGSHFKSSPSKNMWGEIAPHVLPCDKSVLLTAWAVKMSHTLSHGGFTLNVETSLCTLKVAQNEVTQRCIAWLIKIAHYFHLKIHTIYHSCFDRLPLETLTQNSMTHSIHNKEKQFWNRTKFSLKNGIFCRTEPN